MYQKSKRIFKLILIKYSFRNLALSRNKKANQNTWFENPHIRYGVQIGQLSNSQIQNLNNNVE